MKTEDIILGNTLIAEFFSEVIFRDYYSLEKSDDL